MRKNMQYGRYLVGVAYCATLAIGCGCGVSNRRDVLRDTRKETAFARELVLGGTGGVQSQTSSTEDRYKDIQFHWVRRDTKLPKDSLGEYPVVEEVWGKSGENTKKLEKVDVVRKDSFKVFEQESVMTSAVDNLKQRSETEVKVGTTVWGWMLLGMGAVIFLMIGLKMWRDGKEN